MRAKLSGDMAKAAKLQERLDAAKSGKAGSKTNVVAVSDIGNLLHMLLFCSRK